jgi:hypothetical protein
MMNMTTECPFESGQGSARNGIRRKGVPTLDCIWKK